MEGSARPPAPAAGPRNRALLSTNLGDRRVSSCSCLEPAHDAAPPPTGAHEGVPRGGAADGSVVSCVAAGVEGAAGNAKAPGAKNDSDSSTGDGLDAAQSTLAPQENAWSWVEALLPEVEEDDNAAERAVEEEDGVAARATPEGVGLANAKPEDVPRVARAELLVLLEARKKQLQEMDIDTDGDGSEGTALDDPLSSGATGTGNPSPTLMNHDAEGSTTKGQNVNSAGPRGRKDELYTHEMVLSAENINHPKAVKCRTKGCGLTVCSVWSSNLAPDDPLFECLDCQMIDFDGWSQKHSNLPLKVLSDELRWAMWLRCTSYQLHQQSLFPDLPSTPPLAIYGEGDTVVVEGYDQFSESGSRLFVGQVRGMPFFEQNEGWLYNVIFFRLGPEGPFFERQLSLLAQSGTSGVPPILQASASFSNIARPSAATAPASSSNIVRPDIARPLVSSSNIARPPLPSSDILWREGESRIQGGASAMKRYAPPDLEYGDYDSFVKDLHRWQDTFQERVKHIKNRDGVAPLWNPLHCDDFTIGRDGEQIPVLLLCYQTSQRARGLGNYHSSAALRSDGVTYIEDSWEAVANAVGGRKFFRRTIRGDVCPVAFKAWESLEDELFDEDAAFVRRMWREIVLLPLLRSGRVKIALCSKTAVDSFAEHVMGDAPGKTTRLDAYHAEHAGLFFSLVSNAVKGGAHPCVSYMPRLQANLEVKCTKTDRFFTPVARYLSGDPNAECTYFMSIFEENGAIHRLRAIYQQEASQRGGTESVRLNHESAERRGGLSISDWCRKNGRVGVANGAAKRNMSVPEYLSANAKARGTAKQCKCKKSKCLNLYCPCVAQGLCCSSSCKCNNCQNTSDSRCARLDKECVPHLSMQGKRKQPSVGGRSTGAGVRRVALRRAGGLSNQAQLIDLVESGTLGQLGSGLDLGAFQGSDVGALSQQLHANGALQSGASALLQAASQTPPSVGAKTQKEKDRKEKKKRKEPASPCAALPPRPKAARKKCDAVGNDDRKMPSVETASLEPPAETALRWEEV